MAIGITVAGSVVIGSGVGIPFDNIAATAVTGTKTIPTGVSQNFSTINVAYGMAPITYSISPSLSITGLAFNTGNGNITGTATSTTAGISYAVTATDQYSRSASASFTLVVETVFDTTLVIASRTVTAGVNETGFVPVTYSGGTAPVTLAISPAITSLGLSFNTSNGAISGNATSTIAATSYTITATDATSQQSSKNFTMTVAAPAFATTLSISSRTLTAGTADSFTPVTVTSGSTGYGTKVWSLVSTPALPSGLSLNSANGLISGTPTINRASTSYTIRVTDGLGQTSEKTFSMTVNAPALTSVLSISSRTLQLNAADSYIPVTLGSAGYGTKTWSITSGSLPTGLTLDSSNGTIFGTPTVEASATNITIRITDGLSQTSSKTTSITVTYTPTYSITAPYSTNFGVGAVTSSYIDSGSSVLYAWGTGTSGQLGTNAAVNKSTPTQIATTMWSAIATGGGASIAIRSDGTLWSWGAPGNGQLGLNEGAINRSSPTQIGSATNWRSVQKTEQGSSSAINNLGQLWTWGTGTSGQLGVGDAINRSTPVQVSGSWIIAGLSVTGAALDSNYRLWTWGAAGNSRLGDGTTFNRSTPVQIDFTNRYIDLSVGTGHIMVMRDDFTIWTWGLNTSGQLGTNDTVERSVPTQVGSSSWILVKAGATSSFGIKNDNTLWAWGNNSNGVLGISDTINRSSPVQVGTSGWISISSGSNGSGLVAISSDNKTYAWGLNTTGQKGDNTIVNKSSPVQITLGQLLPTNTSKILSRNGYSSYFIKTQNNDYSLWGAGGQEIANAPVGDNTTIAKSSPVQIGSGPLNDWYSVARAGDSSIGIKSDGTLWTWGENNSGVLGLNIATFSIRSKPAQVGTESNWTIVAGSSAGRAAAINSLGQLFVWGLNTNGQLGVSDTISRSSPVQVAGSWIAVAMGGYITAAINSTYKLFTWGQTQSNLSLGDGTTFNRSSPVQVGTSSWIQVAATNLGGLALRSDSTLWSWGNNTSGYVGDGTTISRSVPTQIGTSSWVVVSAHVYVIAAIKLDKTLWTWGTNANGQLGIGTTTNRSSPTQVGGSWNMVSMDSTGGIAINTSNAIYTWGTNGGSDGDNNGDGTTIARSSPVLIYSGGTPTLDYLVVGGGGGGGGNRGGGGGAGGYVEGTDYPVKYGDTITVTVGDKGSAGTENSSGGDGENSSISSTFNGTITAYGGGGGANNFTATGPGNSINGNNGGSGGGGGMTDAGSGQGIGGVGVYTGSSYVNADRQGFNGGAGSISDTNGGGGGGAFSSGGDATTSVGGDGGKGRQWRDGVTYAGGGGGGANGSGTGGAGGAGGGGNGVTGSTAAAAGGTNTGGGGGGGGAGSTAGAAGGTGVVIIRYPSVYPAAASTTGTPTVTTSNGYRYYKWTTVGSGSITF